MFAKTSSAILGLGLALAGSMLFSISHIILRSIPLTTLGISTIILGVTSLALGRSQTKTPPQASEILQELGFARPREMALLTKLKTYLNGIICSSTIGQRFYAFNFVKVVEAELAFKFLDPAGGEEICDIACGIGLHCIELAKRGCNVYGLDIKKESVRSAKLITAKHKPCLVVGSGESLPYRDEAFDKLLCVSSLEHFIDDESALTEFGRVLKKNGALVMTVDSFGDTVERLQLKKHRKDHNVVNYYALPELRVKIEQAGFTMTDAKYFMNSRICSFFFEVGIRFRFGILSRVLFPFALVLSVVSGRLSSDSKRGYQLAVRAEKGLDQKRVPESCQTQISCFPFVSSE
jgi:ubiquinone/menaquinone biosynthesis C-methylase UbiE